MSFYRRHVDGNHSLIARALRKVTIVTDVHALGAAGCDLIARHLITKAPVFIEVKNPARPKSSHDRSANERRMRDDYPDHWRQVLTVDDALAAVGVPMPRLPLLQDVFKATSLDEHASTLVVGRESTSRKKPKGGIYVGGTIEVTTSPTATATHFIKFIPADLSPLARRARRTAR